MRRAHLAEDIQPISRFRASTADLIRQVRTKKRPLVLTLRGRSAAVVLDVAEYEDLLEELELLRDVQTALRQEEQGKLIPHDTVKSQVRKALR
jgi:antitoxin YefM